MAGTTDIGLRYYQCGGFLFLCKIWTYRYRSRLLNPNRVALPYFSMVCPDSVEFNFQTIRKRVDYARYLFSSDVHDTRGGTTIRCPERVLVWINDKNRYWCSVLFCFDFYFLLSE